MVLVVRHGDGPSLLDDDADAVAGALVDVDDRTGDPGFDRFSDAVGGGLGEAGHAAQGCPPERQRDAQIDDLAATLGDLEADRLSGLLVACFGVVLGVALRRTAAALRRVPSASRIGPASSALKRPSATRRRTDSRASSGIVVVLGGGSGLVRLDRPVPIQGLQATAGLGDIDLAALQCAQDVEARVVRFGRPGLACRCGDGGLRGCDRRRAGRRSRRPGRCRSHDRYRGRGRCRRDDPEVAGRRAERDRRAACPDDQGAASVPHVAASRQVGLDVARDGLRFDADVVQGLDRRIAADRLDRVWPIAIEPAGDAQVTRRRGRVQLAERLGS